MPKKVTLKEFLTRSAEVHGETYDYSKVEFKGMGIPVTIVCKVHGEFIQKPTVHIKDKCGCPVCGKSKQSRQLDQETVIDMAREVHGDKYDYSRVEYKNALEKIAIVCKLHGEFLQRADAHIHQGQGCPVCGLQNRSYRPGKVS